MKKKLSKHWLPGNRRKLFSPNIGQNQQNYKVTIYVIGTMAFPRMTFPQMSFPQNPPKQCSLNDFSPNNISPKRHFRPNLN
jgi:hypothetical protein